MQCSRSSGQGWHCKRETDLSYKLCYHHKQLNKEYNSRKNAKAKALGFCTNCYKRKVKKGLLATCEVCTASRVAYDAKYLVLNREVINETCRLWIANLRAGLPTSMARRAQMIERAEVDSGEGELYSADL